MKNSRSIMSLMGLILIMVLQAAGAATNGGLTNQWTKERANQWYAEQAWRVGCNFIPSTAINQLEMWQAESWDPETIDQELLWASKLGMNSVRVSLHDLAWEADAEGFKKRIDQFLTIAAKYKIKPMVVFFDDCLSAAPQLGKQAVAKSSVHNRDWLQSPGQAVVNDPAQWERLERYVKDILNTFGNDPRILFWDLYNEPGNSGQMIKSLPLLKETFKWARSVNPTQPLSVGIWNDGLKELNDFQLAASDIITFHSYGMAADLSSEIQLLKKHGRPLLCTIWLRHGHSEAATFLPVFKQENVACYNWGLVSGKSQTLWPWGTKVGTLEPECWFHNLLRKDGTAQDPAEVEIFRNITEISVREESTARPLTVAHRGVSKFAPENTLPAFDLAWEQGADAIEGDFQLTKDGHIVCIHDRNTNRTTDGNLIVANSTLSELRELDAGAWFAEEFTSTYIPTLTEVLSTVPAGKKIYIEIKCGVEIIPTLLEDVKQSGLSEDQIVVISFKQKVLKQLKAVAPGYKTSWLVSFKKSRKLGKISPTYSAVLETLSLIQADGLSTSRNLVDAFFISLLTERGVGHHVWTIDDGKTAKHFQKLGTKSITTNVPEDILSAYDFIPAEPTPALAP